MVEKCWDDSPLGLKDSFPKRARRSPRIISESDSYIRTSFLLTTRKTKTMRREKVKKNRKTSTFLLNYSSLDFFAHISSKTWRKIKFFVVVVYVYGKMGWGWCISSCMTWEKSGLADWIGLHKKATHT